MIAVLERPRSPIAVTKREYKELLDRLSPKSHTRVRCCAAQLISYFEHWHQWKEAHYPTRWIYQPLTEIRHDLMDAFTIHVVREAIAVLQSLGFLSVRRNSRAENLRNGQDRTHQYLLHSDRIELALENVSRQPAAETLETTPFVNVEIPSVNVEIPKFTVETYTQIPYSDSCPDSCSLPKDESEKIKSDQEQEDFCGHNDQQEKSDDGNSNNKTSFPKDESSGAALTSKCTNSTHNVVPLPPRKTTYFRSSEEKKGFYQALLELGRNKSGVKSAPGWANAIIQSIESGQPCVYLDEYRRGELPGTCELREWEVSPGQPYPQFVTYLKRRLMGNQMSIEQATAEAFQKLRDVNVAAALWEGFKQELLNRSEDWQRQRSLGVSNAYLPPELVPQPEVPVAEVVDALRSLQSGCVQIQQPLAPSTEQASLFVVGDEMPALEPEGEVAATVSAQTPEPVSLSELQEKLNSRRYVNIARMMIRSNPGWGYKLDEELNLVLPADGSMPPQGHIQDLLDNKLTKNSALALIEKHPEWGLFVDDEGQLWD